MDGINTVWDSIAADVKASVWGPPKPQEPDAFYAAKFLNGEVVPGWSFEKYMLDRVADIPRCGTRNCHSVLRKLHDYNRTHLCGQTSY